MTSASNIVLIGMMGSGKSTVGKVLADVLGFNFVDLDELIAQAEGIEIAEIFARRGEAYFRELETAALEVFEECKDAVISTGGGIVKNEANIAALKKIGAVFYLAAPANVLYDRINGDNKRPLLKTYEEFAQILNEREDAYKKADFTIDAAKSPQEAAEEIIEKWK